MSRDLSEVPILFLTVQDIKNLTVCSILIIPLSFTPLQIELYKLFLPVKVRDTSLDLRVTLYYILLTFN